MQKDYVTVNPKYVGSALDFHADDPGSSPGERTISTNATRLPPSREHTVKSKAYPSHTMSMWYGM